MDFGVTLFFLLSGFLLFRPWALARADRRPAPAAKAYLWRRALRILPAYWLAVAAAMYLEADNDPEQLIAWVRHLTFTQVSAAGHLAHGLTQTWSLSVEVSFYVLLPVLAAWVARPAAGGWRPVADRCSRIGLLALATVGWLCSSRGPRTCRPTPPASGCPRTSAGSPPAWPWRS